MEKINQKSNGLLWVTGAQYVDGYKLLLTFNDHTTKTVDLQNHLHGEVFEPLQNIAKFKRFKLSDWTIEWENGADFAPEYLYQIGA